MFLEDGILIMKITVGELNKIYFIDISIIVRYFMTKERK